MLIEVKKSVSKETYELGQALAAMVKGVKEALSDGWQPTEDMPKLFAVLVGNLGQAVEGVKASSSEYQANPEASMLAIAMALSEIVASLKE